MSTMYIDVDTAVTVPVNISALIDDTDFKSRETGVTFDQAGMDLVWNFQTTAGVTSQTAVTPTTAGDYDWSETGDAMYKIEIPASGGVSINNDTEGFGWFTGFATGILPWVGPVVTFRAAALNNALIDGGDVLDTNVTEWLSTAVTVSSTTAKPEVDSFSVSDDATAANNLELQYDTTGLTGDTFPSTQSQVGNIATGAGGLSALITAFAKVGAEPETNTFTSTQEGDLVYHIVEDDVGNTDFYYQATVGAGASATAFEWRGYVQSNGDSTSVWYWDWAGTAYKQIDTLIGANGTTPVEERFTVPVGATGTGSDQGKVRLRFLSTTTTAIATDRLLCEFTQSSQSVGYANGQIWVDSNSSNTNTVSFVDGVADNPAGSWADAITLSGQTGLTDFHLLNGSTAALTGNSDNFSLFGDNWILQLASQSVAGAYFQGAIVSGVGTSSAEVHFEGCEVQTMSVQIGHFDFCSFAGTVTHTLAGDYNYHNCYSGVAGPNGPTFAKTAGQVITAQWRGWKGSINLTGLEVGDTLTIGGDELGTIDLGSPAGAVVVEIRGIYKALANVGSAAVNLDGAINAADVALILADTSELQGVLSAGILARSNNPTLNALLGVADVASTNIADAIADEVLTGATHNVTNSLGRRIREIQELGSYGGFIWVDTTSGTAGTTNFENGVDTNPVDNIADANTLAASLGIKQFKILNSSSITLAANQDGDHFFGDGWTLALGGQSCSGSLFEGANVTGICTGAIAPKFIRCDVGAVTVPPSKFEWCSIESTITAGSAGDFLFHHSWSGVAGAGAPTFDFGALLNASGLCVRSHSGGWELENMGQGTGSYNTSIEGWGQLILNANCDPSGGPVIELRGDYVVTDNVAGGYVAGGGTLNLLATFNRESMSAYNEGVWLDTNGSNTNTDSYSDGTADKPVSTVAAAYTIAAAVNVETIRVIGGSALTLPSDSSFKTFRGENYSIALNGQDIEGASFHNAASITGIGTGGASPPGFFVCGIGSVTLPPSNGFECGFFGTFTIGSAGSYTFGGSATVFDATFIIDYGALLNASEFFLPSWGGGAVEIQNAGVNTGTYKFEMSGMGDLTINVNCVATTEVTLRGSIDLTNNATGITLVNEANYNETQAAANPVILADSEDIYHADIVVSIDESNTEDMYLVTWMKNGVLITSGITVPTIQVVDELGADLIASTAMTAVTDGILKHQALTTARQTAGEPVIVEVTATIDTATRTFRTAVRRDSSA